MTRRRVPSIDYWDYFWQQFDSMYHEDCQGYADYDLVYRRTKELVDSQLEISSQIKK